MNPKFNTPTTRTETPSNTLSNIKKLATRTALGLAMVTGGVAFNPEMANTANTANLQQPRQPTQIASADISNSDKEMLDSVYSRALRLSNAIGVPIRLVVTNQSAYFQMRDHYIQPDNTKNNIESCYGTSQQVSLSSYKSEKTGLVKEGFSGDKCALQLPVQFFGQAGDPIENFKSQYSKMHGQITTDITQYEFTNEQYVMLTEKLLDIIDNKGDGKNIKNVIIYVSPLMAYHVNNELNKVLQALNVPGLKRQHITFSSEPTHKTLLKMKNDKAGVKIKGRDDTLLINLPKMMETVSK